jgi:ATP-dependent RNA circularization protein (DNA/RNA ligase family)
MALGDQAGIEAVKLLTNVTIPAARQAVSEIIRELNGSVISLANGAVITITIAIPEKKP